ncbi:MAG: hypothetical protein WC788_07430 [Candidatus Paceibacterota bacterium]
MKPENKRILAALVISALIIAGGTYLYQDWKQKPENRDPYHFNGIVSEIYGSPVEGMNITVSNEVGISVATKSDKNGEFKLDVPACLLKTEYQTIATEEINQGPVISISQAEVKRYWICGDPWKISIKMEKDGFSSTDETTISARGKYYVSLISLTSKPQVSNSEPSREIVALTREKEIAWAEYWLGLARVRPEMFMVDFTREHVKNANVSFEEIGTSSDELNVLEKQAYMSSAKFWAASIRGEPELFKIHFLLSDMKRAHSSLDAIGISISEISDLVREAHKRSAEFWLASARKDPEQYKIDFIIMHSIEGRIPLEKLGTTEWELKALREKA